jgi:ABC-2 type transport system ATP-binding protein
MANGTTTRATAIEVRALEKRYGETQALAGLDLSLPHGTFYGLLGPNGAGKTTTVSILTTLERPSRGEARVFDHDVVRDATQVRPLLGVVFQESSLDRELTAREHLDLQGRLYHLEARRSRVEEMLKLLGLEGQADRPVRQLSGGMKRRLEIARGLLHRPRILFLDEPTVGLDVAARAAIWSHLREIHATGEATLFLTTHSMEEADQLCERIGILDGGRLVAEGSPEGLKAELGGDVVSLQLERPKGAAAALTGVAGVTGVVVEDGDGWPAQDATRVRVMLPDGPQRLPALLEAARPFGVAEVTLRRPTLEHVFLHHTGHPFEPDLEGGTARR